MISKSTLILFVSCVGAAVFAAEETPMAVLLVLNKGNNSLAIVDPVKRTVVAEASAGRDPHEVVGSADGKLAFISNYGGGHTLSVIDLVAWARMENRCLATESKSGLAYMRCKWPR
jgi:hypothetical protein